MRIKRIFIGVTIVILGVLLSACQTDTLEIPLAPSNLTLEGSTISWDKSEHATNYQVFLDSILYNTEDLDYDLTAQITLFTGKVVEVKVKAENNLGISESSNVLRITYQQGFILEENIELDTLATPTNLLLTKDILVWDSVSNAVNYQLKIGETSVVVGDTMINLFDYQSSITINTAVKIKATATGYRDSLEGTIFVSKGYDGRIYPADKTPTEPEKLDYIDFYYINDFHGAIEKSDEDIGLAYIGNFITQRRLENPSLFLLAGGDMLQGSALSNYYQGYSTIRLMSLMGFDAMALGNHEFDWGLEEVTKYFDGVETNGEATFPLLSINTFKKGTKDLPEHILPYTLIEKGGYKVGVIASIGYGLESSIAYARVEAYEFAYPLEDIKSTTKYLREHDGADVVVVITHDNSSSLTNSLANLTGTEAIDVIFTAHSHSRILNQIKNTIIIQSGANGEYLGYVRLDMKNRSNSTYNNINSHSDFNTADPIIQNQIDQYKLETDDYFNTEIIQNNSYVSTSDLSDWLAKLMRIKTNSDIAFHNYGGTRDYIRAYESITLGRLYDIFPFDNIVKTVYLSGSEINYFMNKGNAYYTDVTYFEPNELYKVATNDYIFDKPENPFIYGTDQENTGILLRDLIGSELELQALIYSRFSINNTIQTIFIPEAYQFIKFETII